MPFSSKEFKQEFNQLLKLSESFDKMYCLYNALDLAPESEVSEAHEAIIRRYQALITGLSQSKKKEKADVYNNMHVQYEGLRKYYGICYDKTPIEAIAKKRELLDKQNTCNAQCIFYTHSSRDTYSSESDKKFEAEYLEEYEGVKTLLDAEKKRLEQSTTASSQIRSCASLSVDTSLPGLVRNVSKHTETGIGHLLSLRQSSSSSDGDSIACASEEEHSDCASTLLTLATPRACSPQTSIELINQCWRDLHLLSQSEIFKRHPQRVNILASVQLLATIKIGLEDEKLEHNSAPSLSTQSFMAPPRTIGVKRTHHDEQQEDRDTHPTQASSSSSSFN